MSLTSERPSVEDTEPGDATTLRRVPGRAEIHPASFARRRRITDLSLAIGVPVALVLLWQAAVEFEWIDNRLYPSPTEIVSKTRSLFADRDLGTDILTSIRRVLIGFGIGAVLGALFGIVMGLSRPIRAALEAMLTALYTVPKLAILPIFLLMFGFGEAPIYALIAVTVFFFVWISSLSAVMAVPEGYRDAATVFGASRWQLFRHVILPGALPQIFVGLRIAAGVAVLILVSVEFILGGDGVGHVINQGRILGLHEQTYVGIVISAAIGVAFSFIVRWIGRRLSPWAPDDNTPQQG